MKATRLIVHGRVQGVGFRAFTQRAAERHGVAGYVRNRGDGSVEIVAQGGRLKEFLADVRRGPSYGHVDSADEGEIEAEEFPSFTVRY